MPLTINLTPKGASMLEKLARIEPAAANELGIALAEQLEKLGTLEEVVSTASGFKTIGLNEAADLLGFLAHLCMEHLSKVEQPKELLKAITDAIPRLAKPIDKSLLRSLQTNLKIVFGEEMLQLKSKALRLMQSHDNVLSTVEVLSDIRPVFGAGASPKIESAVMFHTLALEFMQERDMKRMSFAMDGQDLIKLKSAVERAIAKEKAIKKFLTDAGTSFVAVD